jgi:hypothetical protein
LDKSRPRIKESDVATLSERDEGGVKEPKGGEFSWRHEKREAKLKTLRSDDKRRAKGEKVRQ